MSVSLNMQNNYAYMQQRNPADTIFGGRTETGASQKSQKNQQLRDMLRNLDRVREEKRCGYGSMQQAMRNGTSPLYGSNQTTEAEKEIQKVSNYNYKEVANKILRAKTALSAGQAVIAAKRKVLEVKNKISVGDGDPEELQIALTHAKRMEIAAKKKKRHLEMEELVVSVQKMDEKLERMEETADSVKDMSLDLAKEEIMKQEDAVFEERSELTEELKQQLEEHAEALSEEEITRMNEMIAEFGEEELKQLEEAMEMLESLEIINPHMSEEDLEELKRKHRAAEQKAIVKAEMDYLKDMIKYVQEKMTAAPDIKQSVGISAGMPMAGNSVMPPAEAAGGGAMVQTGFDVQI